MPTVMDLIALRFTVFLDLVPPDCHVVAAVREVSLASSTAGRTKLRIVDLIAIIPLIDRV